jgi:hypothetical protein
MEADPPLESLDLLLGELETSDPEHPDVAVSHESGWTLSVFPSGRVIYENVEDLGQQPRQLVLDRSLVMILCRALVAGDLARLESEDWQPMRRE